MVDQLNLDADAMNMGHQFLNYDACSLLISTDLPTKVFVVMGLCSLSIYNDCS